MDSKEFTDDDDDEYRTTHDDILNGESEESKESKESKESIDEDKDYRNTPDYIWNETNRVLIVKSALFDGRHSRLSAIMDNWMKSSCNFNFTNRCQMYRTCRSYVCLALDERVLLQNIQSAPSLVDWLTVNPEYIASVCFAIEFSNAQYRGKKGFFEIYSVCTRNTSRGKGYAERMFKAITGMSTNPHLWLGVEAENPMFGSAVKLYIKAGFGFFEITDRTPGGAIIGRNVIGMTYSKDTPSAGTVEQAERLQHNILRAPKTCTLNAFISANIVKQLEEYVKYYVYEYGGLFSVNEVKNNDVILAYPLASEVIGNQGGLAAVFSNDDSSNVRIPTSMFTFHTHPQIAYLKYDSYVGWPSGADMSMLVQFYTQGMRKHIVATNEGIYDYQLTPDYMLLLHNNNAHVNVIAQAVAYIFSTFHKYRKSDVVEGKSIEGEQNRIRGYLKPYLDPNNSQKNTAINTFLTTTNNLNAVSIHTNLPPGELKDRFRSIFQPLSKIIQTLPIFNIRFVGWGAIREGGYTTTLSYPSEVSRCEIEEVIPNFRTSRFTSSGNSTVIV